MYSGGGEIFSAAAKVQERRTHDSTENTYLLFKWKYHCTADLLLDGNEFSNNAYIEIKTDFFICLNQN